MARENCLRTRQFPSAIGSGRTPIGQQVAAFVVSGNDIADRVAEHLARVWPKAAPQPPSPAGAELLVRAGAIPAESIVPETMTVKSPAIKPETRIANENATTRR